MGAGNVSYQARSLTGAPVPIEPPSEAAAGELQPATGEIEELQTEEQQRAETADKLWLVRLASVIVVFGGWEILGRQVNPIFMSYPTAIAVAAWQMTMSGELLHALLVSTQTLLTGFVLALVLGIGFGLLIGRYRTFEAATDWMVSVLYATPLVATIPLVILWFGLGFAAKVFVVTILALFPVLINTAAGVKNVPRPLIDVGAAYAADERQLFTMIIVPSALPYIMTGVRLAVGRAIIGMVVAEFFTALSGLGALIVNYGSRYDTAAMFVPIIVLMALGVVLTMLARRAEEWFAPWKEVRD
jgi:NitT/TauT family transport system permease protein